MKWKKYIYIFSKLPSFYLSIFEASVRRADSTNTPALLQCKWFTTRRAIRNWRWTAISTGRITLIATSQKCCGTARRGTSSNARLPWGPYIGRWWRWRGRTTTRADRQGGARPAPLSLCPPPCWACRRSSACTARGSLTKHLPPPTCYNRPPVCSSDW